MFVSSSAETEIRLSSNVLVGIRLGTTGKGWRLYNYLEMNVLKAQWRETEWIV